MWVAHLFSDKDRLRCHRSPQSSATARTCIPREHTAGLHCISVARKRSLGKGVSQKLVGGRTRRLYKRSDVRCHFCKNDRLFDGEARCCKSVDDHDEGPPFAWLQR